MYGRQFPQRGYNPRPIAPPPPQQSGFGQGVKQFIDTYRAEQQGKKAEARQLFEQHAQMMEAGIPVDKKKMAKWARQADLHFDLDAPPPPPAQAPMTPDPRMQQAAQVGMQQSLGGPQMAPPPPQPQPRQGMMSRLGEAMGVPQPPSQQQQMGVMRMLKDMEARGQQNKQMAGMQRDMQMKGMQALQTIEQGLSMGLTMEDPRMMQALSTVQMLSGLQGGKMGGALEDILGNAVARKNFPKIIAGMEEQATKAEASEREGKLRSSVAEWAVKNGVKMDKVMPYFRGETDELDTAAVGGEDSAKILRSIIPDLDKEYPDASPETKAQYALMMASPNPDTALIFQAREALGPSRTEKSDARAQATAGRSERSTQMSEASLNLRQQREEEKARVAMLAEKLLTKHRNDPEEAAKYVSEISSMNSKPGDILRVMEALRMKGGSEVTIVNIPE